MDSQLRFNGKVAIVTGGAKGIGAAVARALAREGAAVTVLDVDAEAAMMVVDEIARAGGRALAITGTVASATDAERSVAATVERFGRLDVLVNSAAVVIYAKVTDLAEEDWDRQLDTNLKGQFLMAKYAIPQMRIRGGGVIVNFSSVQAVVSQREVAAYAASKGGVVSLTKTLALDHAQEGIRVNCILPGSVRTPMLWQAAERGPGDPEQTIAAWGRIHPRGTVIEPDEVATVVLFLASDAASAVTGGAYTVDAGLSSQCAV